jgi:hypothetical protein
MFTIIILHMFDQSFSLKIFLMNSLFQREFNFLHISRKDFVRFATGRLRQPTELSLISGLCSMPMRKMGLLSERCILQYSKHRYPRWRPKTLSYEDGARNCRRRHFNKTVYLLRAHMEEKKRIGNWVDLCKSK